MQIVSGDSCTHVKCRLMERVKSDTVEVTMQIVSGDSCAMSDVVYWNANNAQR